jgi:hypothetical protein
MKKLLWLICFIPSLSFAQPNRIIQGTFDKEDTASLNLNFDNIKKDNLDAVHKTSTETITGVKHFDYVTLSTVSLAKIQFADGTTQTTAPTVSTTTANWTTLVGTTVTSFGTISNASWFYKRIGDTIYVKGNFTVGTAAGAAAEINLPSGIVIDSTKIASNMSTEVGYWYNLTNALQTLYSTAGAGILFFSPGDTSKIFFASQTSGFSFVKANGSGIAVNATNFSLDFSIPVVGY